MSNSTCFSRIGNLIRVTALSFFLGACSLSHQQFAAPSGLLHWQGHLETGDPASDVICRQIKVNSDATELALGNCGEPPSQVVHDENVLAEIKALAARVGKFNLATPKDNLYFDGHGTEARGAWQRAILKWAHLQFEELDSGHACAACATVFNWYLDKTDSGAAECRQLYATFYGRAFAQKVNCNATNEGERGANQGWLEPAEVETLDQWINKKVEYHDEHDFGNYLMGEGTEAVRTEDRRAMYAWAETIFKRLMPK